MVSTTTKIVHLMPRYRDTAVDAFEMMLCITNKFVFHNSFGLHNDFCSVCIHCIIWFERLSLSYYRHFGYLFNSLLRLPTRGTSKLRTNNHLIGHFPYGFSWQRLRYVSKTYGIHHTLCDSISILPTMLVMIITTKHTRDYFNHFHL